MEEAVEEQRVVIAAILRSRGNKGEVLARSLSDVPGRLEDLKKAHVRLLDGSDVAVDVEASWPHKGDWVFKFAGVNSISDAEKFARSEVWIPRAERGDLPPGDYFEADLIGCLVVDRATSELIGPVVGVVNFGASPLLEVVHQEREIMVPLVDAICQVVDLPGRKILVELPEGLLDL